MQKVASRITGEILCNTYYDDKLDVIKAIQYEVFDYVIS